MGAIDYEAEYNNRRRVPEHPAILARWAEASRRVRENLGSELDVPYGARPRQRYDLFRPAQDDASGPLVVYLHGGYWQRGDRTEYSFVAEPFVSRGAMVAIPSYSLCPEVSVADIIAEVRTFLALVWHRLRRRPVVVGHSAGGHLTAAMLASDWAGEPGVPADLVRAGCAISGVFDLAPLIPTSLNEAMRLDDRSARAASPLQWRPPGAGSKLVAAVGGAESAEFLRQSRDIARLWSGAGVEAECLVVPDANHFTVLDELCRPDSVLLRRILDLAA